MKPHRSEPQQIVWYSPRSRPRNSHTSEGRRPGKLTDDQDIVYEFGRELNDNHGATDRTYARAVTRFGEQGVMDLVGVNGFYSLISMALNVGRTPLPPGVAPAFKPTPR